MSPRFQDPDRAAAWYNGWLRVIPPPRRPLDPEFGWDPVRKASEVYWYIVGTGDTQSLVVESPETLLTWVNQYYHHYALLHGNQAADALLEGSHVPEQAVPDLEPSTPEAEWLMAGGDDLLARWAADRETGVVA